MGILEVAQTAQTQLDKLCTETGVPADQIHVAIVMREQNDCDISFVAKWGDLYERQGSGRAFMSPLAFTVDADGCIQSFESSANAFYNRCRARAAELAPPEPPPFDAEQAIRDAGGWMVPDGRQVLAVGTACDALVKDGAWGDIKRRFDDSESVVTVGMIVEPRSIVQGTVVLAVLPRGVVVCVDPDELCNDDCDGCKLEPYYVTWFDGEKRFKHFTDYAAAVRAAVALATETQP